MWKDEARLLTAQAEAAERAQQEAQQEAQLKAQQEAQLKEAEAKAAAEAEAEAEAAAEAEACAEEAGEASAGEAPVTTTEGVDGAQSAEAEPEPSHGHGHERQAEPGLKFNGMAIYWTVAHRPPHGTQPRSAALPEDPDRTRSLSGTRVASGVLPILALGV